MHTFVRIIELLIGGGLAAAVTLIFVISLIAIVHGLRTVGRQH